MTLGQFPLQRHAQVRDLLVVDEQVRVARDSKGVAPVDFHPGEELADMGLHDRREQHDVVRVIGQSLRQPDQARQCTRRLHDRHAGLAAERIVPPEFDGEVQALVEHARERMRGVQADRREHRQDLDAEILARPCRDGFVPVGRDVDDDALGREQRQQRLVEDLVLPLHELVGAGRHEIERRVRGHAVDVGMRRVKAHLLLQARHADFEELVEVAARDAQEAQAFEERKRVVVRLCEHAVLEGEERQLSIEELGGMHGLGHEGPPA